jgi:hypothetical protein
MRLHSRNLRPHTTDARARNHAKRLAEEWRAAGLVVDLIEYVDTATDPGGYGLTARSRSSIMSCRCQSWVVRTLPWRRRALWTISVSVRAAGLDADSALAPPAQPAGVAAAWDHERAWETVQDWIDGAGTLPPNLDAALATLR